VNGGGIAIDQEESGNIVLNSITFSTCITEAVSLSGFGWGGAIYIWTKVEASELSETNFLLTNLGFTGCISAVGYGNNIFIRSENS
jgi:hypothetical protein